MVTELQLFELFTELQPVEWLPSYSSLNGYRVRAG
jgi:hypothetical protein